MPESPQRRQFPFQRREAPQQRSFQPKTNNQSAPEPPVLPVAQGRGGYVGRGQGGTPSNIKSSVLGRRFVGGGSSPGYAGKKGPEGQAVAHPFSGGPVNRSGSNDYRAAARRRLMEMRKRKANANQEDEAKKYAADLQARKAGR